MAEKERFELSRRYSRPTPLAGAPLRPLEYFSVYPSQSAFAETYDIAYYTRFCAICQVLFYFFFEKFSFLSNFNFWTSHKIFQEKRKLNSVQMRRRVIDFLNRYPRKQKTGNRLVTCFLLVRETGLEPVRCEPHAPQTCASASSATPACRVLRNMYIIHENSEKSRVFSKKVEIFFAIFYCSPKDFIWKYFLRFFRKSIDKSDIL